MKFSLKKIALYFGKVQRTSTHDFVYKKICKDPIKEIQSIEEVFGRTWSAKFNKRFIYSISYPDVKLKDQKYFYKKFYLNLKKCFKIFNTKFKG